MPEVQTAPPTSAHEIDDEHKVLGAALARLEETADPARLLPQLEDLRRKLSRHFVSEEANDGLPKIVGPSAPQFIAPLERLFTEHEEFLADLDRLTSDTRALLAKSEEIHSGIADFAGRLRDHEARESELLRDAVYTDFGSGD